jgi:hypothetical protein
VHHIVPHKDHHILLSVAKDIQQALLQTSPGIHIPPNHVAAINQLTEVLTASPILNNDAPVPSPCEYLRVETSKPSVVASLEVDHPHLRVDPSVTIQEPSKKPTTPKIQFAPCTINNNEAYMLFLLEPGYLIRSRSSRLKHTISLTPNHNHQIHGIQQYTTTVSGNQILQRAYN